TLLYGAPGEVMEALVLAPGGGIVGALAAILPVAAVGVLDRLILGPRRGAASRRKHHDNEQPHRFPEHNPHFAAAKPSQAATTTAEMSRGRVATLIFCANVSRCPYARASRG